MRVIGQEQIAEVFGVVPKTIVEWQEQGFPVAARGRPGVPSEYDSMACITWLVEREVRKVCAETPKDRLARVQADKIEMENAEKRGQLVSVAMIEPRMKAAMIAAREWWRNEPARLAREAAGKGQDELEELLQVAFDGLLLRLSRWDDAEQSTEAVDLE